MKRDQWRLLDFNFPSSVPLQGQDIYFTIAEGEGKPFPSAMRMTADPDSFRDLLTLNPDWLVIWQSAPPVPARKEGTDS